MTIEVRIRTGTVADMPDLARLRAAINWSPGDFFLPAIESGRGHLLLATTADDIIIGSGIAVAFGHLGFIGSMITLPAHERRGIARAIFQRLLDWLSSMNATRVELEATPAGGPLYENVFGFKPRWQSMRATLEQSESLGPAPRSVRVVSPDDWPAIARLDQAATGGDRAWIVQALAARPGATTMVALNDAGKPEAYGTRAGERLGPLVASSPAAAQALIRGLAALSPGTIGAGTGGAPGVSDMWEDLGFSLSPYDVRMGWGTEPTGSPEMLYAMINGGLG